MKVLKSMETDGTYNQTAQTQRIVNLANGDIYSFDLSSATDRFPIELQQKVVETLYGKRYSD
jgi:hypothetical protein